MTPLQQELKEFLQEKGVTPLFYPHTRGSKVIEFAVRKEQVLQFMKFHFLPLMFGNTHIVWTIKMTGNYISKGFSRLLIGR